MRYFIDRWRGCIDLRRLFWSDMLLVATLINLALSLGGVLLLTQGLPLGVALTLHFIPVPYNVFLQLAVWRHPRRNLGHMAASLSWLAMMVAV
jgi:hypothetical protein